MHNYCPACGAKLESDFKFCPACGISLNNIQNEKDTEENKSSATENVNLIVCGNCGEENLDSNILCDSCGVQLTGHKMVKSIKQNTTKSSGTTIKSDKTEKRKKTQHELSAEAENKVLDSKKIYITIGVVAIGLLLILVISGAFSSEPVSNINQTNIESQSPGVDLTNLNEINRLQTIVDSIPDDYVSLLELAHLLNDSGLYPKAIENYKRYLEKHADDADARIDMGVCYYNLKDYDNAIKEMTTALKYKPDHQIGHLNLGIVNLSAGNLEKSKEWLQKAVNLNPDTEVGKRAQELLHSH